MKKVSTVSKISIILIMVFSMFYVGCKKDRIKDNSLNAYDSPDSYLDSKEPEEQTIPIDSGGTGPAMGNQGTKLWGTDPHTCLMYVNDTHKVYYPYVLKLVELYKPKDMIYYRMPTVASGKILQTGGEIRLRAFKDNKELTFKPGGTCGMKIEFKNPAPVMGMNIFYGFTNGAGHPDWTDQPTGAMTKTVYGYEGYTQKFGWINCDQYADSSSSATVSFSSTVDELTNIRFFIYIPKTKTVMEVYNTVSDNIPIGSDIKIVGIGMQGSTLFSFYDARKLTSSATIDVEMKQTTDVELTTLLDGL
ncbi:MAG TPA: hypothetical protein VFF27_03780 [Bacteroidia bacterium]|nr:hypothetical protein [Bacteroidia bacterium]